MTKYSRGFVLNKRSNKLNHRRPNENIENQNDLIKSEYLESVLGFKHNLPFVIDPQCYHKAEKRASWYVNQILSLAKSDESIEQLYRDYSHWGAKHLADAEQPLSDSMDSWSFLQKLVAEKKLKHYLDKSITYIFMRDLGLSISDKSAQHKIKKTVARLHSWIKKQNRSTSNKNGQHHQSDLNTALLFKKAQEHQLESTLFWLMGKLERVQANMPSEIDQTHGMRKLVKIIAGVVLHQFADDVSLGSEREQVEKFDKAIRLGYSYGLTYPFIDDLQDSATALNRQEKHIFNQAIRTSLLQGYVVDCPTFTEKNQKQMSFIYNELREAFETIKQHQTPEQSKRFFEQAFVFFEAQDIDRTRKLTDKSYTIEELFLPVILKSSGCRLVAREIVDSQKNESFDHRTFCFGIYNQFNDDIKDIFDDLEEGNVTPYTQFLTDVESGVSPLPLNPYRIYWAVVFYLINHVYEGHDKSRRLLLERSINAHKSLLKVIGSQRYEKLRTQMLHTGHGEFDALIHSLVVTPSDTAWFDKLISRQVADHFSAQKKTKEAFSAKYQSIQTFVEQHLDIKSHSRLEHSTLVEASNYSVKAGGKRLRSVLAYVMCVDQYQFTPEQSINVIQLLEYMHTASIIFDDKPSQDNADLRRGKPTLHKHYNSEATAELAGVFLMMKAVEVQSKIKGVNASYILESLGYAANTTQAICEGQLLDLQSSQYNTNIEHLEHLSFLKTGLAIEASLMIPAILAGENDIEKGYLKQFAKHLGIAFQIKDDLLDLTSDAKTLGKPISQDSFLDKASFVTCLGEEEARKQLFAHYFYAHDALKSLSKHNPFLHQVLEFVVHRTH